MVCDIIEIKNYCTLKKNVIILKIIDLQETSLL